MQIQEETVEKKKKVIAYLYGVFIVFPIYVTLAIFYYLDIINSFVFLGIVIITSIIISILLIIFRKDKLKSKNLLYAVLLLFLLFFYDSRLFVYEGHTYIASGYEEPIELLNQSGIFILPVKFYDVFYFENEEEIRRSYANSGIQLYELEKINNRDRYKSKTNDLIRFFRAPKENFQTMGENVKSYIGGDIEIINEFLSKEDYFGDSAGLALGLTAMIYKGELTNELPIGVTGTLEPNGDVMEVGGIKEKMMISEQDNLPCMIVPMENFEEAETIKSERQLTIEIIPVSHIDEAVVVIKKLNAGGQ